MVLGLLQLCCCSAAVAAGLQTAWAPKACAVSIDLANITNPAVPEASNGCHFSPLDHQLFYVYSQMVYDESFEQAISEHSDPDRPAPALADVKAGGTQPGVSMGWQNLSQGGPGVSWTDDPARAFNGNVSVTLATGGPPAAAGRVGVASRGLYHQGYWLQAGREYTGYLAAKADKPTTVTVSLEDWGADPAGAVSRSAVAATTLTHPGGGHWLVLNYSLTPTRLVDCTPFPYATPPLYCGLPNSQQGFPAALTASCVVCGGTLVVAVEDHPQHDVRAVVSIDQVFLEPGAWGRYKGLHMHKAAAEWLLHMGTKMLRYGGTFTQTVQGPWESARGPAWSRPPCTAGKAVGGRGGCRLTKLARWTRGWGVLEVLAFCEAAGIHCIVGLASQQTPQQLAEFVEYLFGDSSSNFGARRIADGHPQPYQVRRWPRCSALLRVGATAAVSPCCSRMMLPPSS